jgi:translation initiation factor IF-1
MVKNTGGGGNAKKQARKFQGKNKSTDLRKSEDISEKYAIVDLIYGNGLNVYTNDGQEIWCRIPGKFKGRNKRNNFIEKGAWVLIGIYEWEKTEQPKSCELLHIYDRNEIEQLFELPGVNLKTLITKSRSEHTAGSDDDEIEEDGDNDEFGFKFTDKIVDNKTMFANDITNVAIVSFDGEQEVSFDDL